MKRQPVRFCRILQTGAKPCFCIHIRRRIEMQRYRSFCGNKRIKAIQGTEEEVREEEEEGYT